MSLLRQVTHGLRSLFRRADADEDVRDEVDQFMDAAVEDRMAHGATRGEAMRAVRLEYGSSLSAREDVRSWGWEQTLAAVLADARYGLRLLHRNPGFAAVAILTLGLGIGSATAIFSAVYPSLFAPLAYPNAERILSITDLTPDGDPVAVTFGTYREVQQRSRAFESVAVFRSWQPTVTGRGEPERLDGQRVTAEYFAVLGVPPLLGAGFDPADDVAGGPDRVILSDGLWRRLFGADSSLVGRTVTLDGRAYTVVGVMPRDFENVPAPAAQAWTLLQYDASLPTFDGREWGHHLDMVGRTHANVSLEVARRDLDAIAGNPIAELARPPWAALGLGLSLRSLQETITAGTRPALLALLGAVVLLLTIVCVNVTNLLLARGARRRDEMTLRAVLGAAGGRLMRQLLTEGLILAGLGGVVGLVVARFGVAAIVALSPPGLPRVDAIALNGVAFAFVLGLTAVVGIVVGLAPGIGVTHAGVRAGSLTSARVTGRHVGARQVLVVTEVALALVLLVGAGLLLRSVLRISAVKPGFEAARTVVMQVQTSGPNFQRDEDVVRFFDQSLDAVQGVPGVVSASVANQLPLTGDRDVYGVQVEGDMRPEPGGQAFRYTVRPGYFETMGIPVVRGRRLDVRDVAGAAPAVVISEALARTAFSGADPVGQRLHLGRTDLPWYTVVGVVGDVKQVSLGPGPADAAYVTPTQWYFADPAAWFVVRAEGDAAALIPSIKQAIWSVDGGQPVVRVATLADLVVQSDAQRRFALVLLEAFAALALVLAAVGLYGVVSGTVTERTREIGIRSALGATRRSIVALVFRQGMTVTAAGVILGLLGAAAAGNTVTSLLFGVSPLDPVTYAGVVVVLLAAAAAACLVPASRAARVDPATTLRVE